MGKFLDNLRRRKKERSTAIICAVKNCGRDAKVGARYCLSHEDTVLGEVYDEARKQIRVVEDQRSQARKKK